MIQFQNAIFKNSTSNPHMYRVVGLVRLHREIGTNMEIRFKVLQKKPLLNKSKKILSQFWYYELKALSRPTYC